MESHRPTKEKPRFTGEFLLPGGRKEPAKLRVGDETFEVSMKKGGQADVLLFGILTVKDCRPFVNRATVIGKREGDAIVADEIHLLPIGDQAALDDPKLPRYLFIGDSISGNYGKGLRDALKGIANLHHPPTNCGPSGKGAANVVAWLGAHEVKGRHWDVISFNFGHWDAGNAKEKYQASLEKVIGHLEKTGAKLIWVMTCPVPTGYEKAGSLVDGKAPRRTSGVMEKYLNPWAAEVVASHPKITVCDQWALVKKNDGGLYTDWWKGKNVHFGGQPAVELGRLLARHVMKELGKNPGAIHPK